MDPFESFKAAQKASWAHFAPVEIFTTSVAAKLVKHAKVRAGQCVLDVCCGTGVVAVTAACLGARVTGLDLTPAFPKGLHFYSHSYTRAWINNNGSLSFNSAISTYTPNAFPGAPQPMIAPYWARRHA